MTPKLRRWIDLLAALLRRKYPAPFDELRREVPGYPVSAEDPEPKRVFESRPRMFERDKQELRSFGIPIETRDIGDGELGYRLDRSLFYMPYLQLLQAGRKSTPKRPSRYGYRSLPSLTFEPDELAAVFQATRRVEALGISTLTDDARSALRKLGHDLPLTEAAEADGVHHLAQQPEASPETFDALSQALATRKQATFTYHSIDRDVVAARAVHPYGLFFLGHHWYLAAAAPGESLVKNYRLSRMGSVAVNQSTPGTPDYEIPEDFRLKTHAATRHAWELGSGDAADVVVRVEAATGAALGATQLGEPVDGDPAARRFRVRRLDAFARWILGAGGSVVPVSPPELVRELETQVAAALSLYEPDAT
jgi:proteasome accessory factor B